ncbi:cation efflux system protein [Reticulomyxa filosa]|uniref:Cation efflux system protein n=1 Tax=Reticulomyxa filosa TaxID=46433 RepID=X6LRR7_RETFI|nr:cation efflux system protein [Reticulomyxa filosa]|eukprot:ETO03822.1 cation efflux system protein [Reticulomyxa filosa]
MSKGHHHYNIDSIDKVLILSLGINLLLSLVQVIAGLISGSMALIADAFHNLSDVFSFAIVLGARIIGKKPPDIFKSFGYKRIEIIAALINLINIILISVFLILESILRYLEPKEIDGNIIVYTSIFAIGINILTAILVYAVTHKSLNIKAAFLHNISDALSSVGVLLSGVIILKYQFLEADLIVTIIIAIYTGWIALRELPKITHILAEGTPKGLKIDDLLRSIKSLEGVIDLHHLHVWQIDEHKNALEAHIVIEDLHEMENIKGKIKKELRDNYNISHSTLEFEKNNNSTNLENC